MAEIKFVFPIKLAKNLVAYIEDLIFNQIDFYGEEGGEKNLTDKIINN